MRPLIIDFELLGHVISIESIIFVERETQKGILIGKNGLALKKVGTDARKKLEEKAIGHGCSKP